MVANHIQDLLSHLLSSHRITAIAPLASCSICPVFGVSCLTVSHWMRFDLNKCY